MRSTGSTFIILIVIVGLVLGIILVSSPNKTSAPSSSTASPEAVNKDIIGQFEGFNEYSYDIQKQDGKPVVYLFSTSTCPHCEWIRETFDKWAKDNSDKIVAYHWQLDTGDNTLTAEKETTIPQDVEAIYSKFNPAGSVPTFVFGGKYSRVGNGFEQEQDFTKEVAVYNDVLNKLLGQ